MHHHPSNDISPIWFVVAGCLGLTAVVAGTFGAHGLRDTLSEAPMQTFDTAVRYHLVHAAAMLGLLGISRNGRSRWLRFAAVAWCGGVLLFSGSLYALALTQMKWLAWLTPFGGAMLITGWMCIGIAGFRRQTTDSANLSR